MCHTYPIPTETPGDMAEKNAEKNADWQDFRRANHLRHLWTMVEIVVCGLSRKVIGGEAVSSRGLRTMTLNDKFEKH